MKFFFSGIADKPAYEMIAAAQVANILVDPADAQNIPSDREIGIMDSGAFRAFRQGSELSLRHYLSNVARHAERAALIVAPDVVGDARQTFINYIAVKDAPLLKDKIIPVWQWNAAPKEHLEFYLKESRIVGIGGLAQIFRSEDTDEQKRLREKTLTELKALCEKHPDRFHIFGLNFLKGIEQLRDSCFSCDSSVWLRGARYGYVIFQHEKHKYLTQAPARSIPAFSRLSREQRCILSAANIETFLSN